MKKSNLKDVIRTILQELEDESKLSEVNTTSNIDGYETPHAFSGKGEDEHAEDIKSNAEVFDYKSTENKKANTIKLNEGRSLFHLFRDHPDYTPEQKVGVAVREINKLMTEVEKLLKVSTRYKAEANVNNSKMWKTTNRFLLKIDEKIKRISHKIKEMK